MDHNNVDDTEAECGSTSWRIMTGRAKKEDNHSKPEAASPPNHPSDYMTPHTQSGQVATPMVPRPMKGRVTRSDGGTVTFSGVYSQSPATAGKMKKVVPAPPFGFHDDTSLAGPSTSTCKLRWQGEDSRSHSGTTVKGTVVRAVESTSATPGESNKLGESNTCTGSASTGVKEEIQMPNFESSSSSATNTADAKSTLAKRTAVVGPGRSDSLEDELLEQAASNVAGVCCDEIKDHAAKSSSASAQSAHSDPLGGHDSLEMLMEKGMELATNGTDKSNADAK